MSVLVTGGAGYIGSVCVELLRRQNIDTVVYDSLIKGHRTAVPADVPFVRGDTRDAPLLESVIRDYGVSAVMHFAAFIEVGESMSAPARYYENNFFGTKTLLDVMIGAGIEHFIFSSTAAVYGEPREIPITESHPTDPTNAYGATKLAVEQLLQWYARAYTLRYVSLRYFNAAGATEQHGENHEPETHLIPLVIQAAMGRRPDVAIFGTDYPTPDGTCVRDFIHVLDLAEAHLAALLALREGFTGGVFNLGNGAGYSVREVIRAVEAVSGRVIPVREAPRRTGDPARLVASSEKIRRELGWIPRRQQLTEIIASAWQWHQAHPDGYADR
ncbi:MAG: UDP-glucose 4-epimerase GalE [Candidatus Sumerlaeia bacterium]